MNITRGRTSTVAFLDCRTFLCHRFDSPSFSLSLSLSLSFYVSLLQPYSFLLLPVRLAQTLWLLHHAGLWHFCVHLDSFFFFFLLFFFPSSVEHWLRVLFVLSLMASLDTQGRPTEGRRRDRVACLVIGLRCDTWSLSRLDPVSFSTEKFRESHFGFRRVKF